jgi:hypothetical protein
MDHRLPALLDRTFEDDPLDCLWTLYGLECVVMSRQRRQRRKSHNVMSSRI